MPTVLDMPQKLEQRTLTDSQWPTMIPYLARRDIGVISPVCSGDSLGFLTSENLDNLSKLLEKDEFKKHLD